MFEEILKKISEPLDIAIFLLFFAIGFSCETFLILDTSFSESSLGILFAILGLGTKMLIESIMGSYWFTIRRRKRMIDKLKNNYKISDVHYSDLRKIKELLNSGLISLEKFDEQLQKQIDNEFGRLNWKSINLNERLRYSFDNVYDDYKSLYKSIYDLSILLNKKTSKVSDIKSKVEKILEENSEYNPDRYTPYQMRKFFSKEKYRD